MKIIKTLAKAILSLGLVLPLVANAAAFIVPQGGTGQTTFTVGGVLVGNGTSAIQSTLTPTLTSITTTATSTTGGINLTSGCIAISSICLTSFTSADVAAYINASSTVPHIGGTSGDVLQWSGTGWVNKALAALGLNFNQLAGSATIAQGGTGNTAPSFGQVLVGNSSGGYTLTATSSLNILPSPAGSDTQVQFNDAGTLGASSGLIFNKTTGRLTSTAVQTTSGTTTNATSTTLSVSGATNVATLAATGSSTLQNFSATDARINGVLSASSTALFTNGFTAYASSTLQRFTATNATTTNATSTTLAITGATANMLLSTNGTGGVVATSTIGNNQLQNSSVTVNTTAPLGGGGAVSLGGTALTLTCTTCVTSLSGAASSTLLTDNNTFQGKNVFSGLFSASSTSLFGQGFMAYASSTLQNFTAQNSTSTNATSTNFQATTAKFTNLIVNNQGFTSLLGTGLLNTGGVLTLDFSGAWTGTFDGLEGTAYLARANHTGTQAASTITAGTFGAGDYVIGGKLTADNLLVNGSSTLQNFTAQNATTTNATTTRLSVSGNATTTFGGGINLLTGCVSLNGGSCIGSGGSSVVTSVTAGNGSLTISPTTGDVSAVLNLANANTFTARQTFAQSISTLATSTNATTTGVFSAQTATTTTLTTGTLSVGSLAGFLKQVAGNVTTALIDLAADVTGILPYNNGGTGQNSYAAGDTIYASGVNTLAKLTAGASSTVPTISVAGLPYYTDAPSFRKLTLTGLGLFQGGFQANASSTLQNFTAVSATTTNATTTTFAITGNSTSTAQAGINLNTGCFSIGNTCVGGGSAAAAGTRIASFTADVGVNPGSTASTSVMSFTIPANTIGTNGILKVHLEGDSWGIPAGVQFWASLRTATAAFAYGVVTPTNATNFNDPTEDMMIDFFVYGSGATNTQEGTTKIVSYNSCTGGDGNNNAGLVCKTRNQTSAIDTTTDQAVQVYVQWPTAVAFVQTRMNIRNGWAEIVKP